MTITFDDSSSTVTLDTSSGIYVYYAIPFDNSNGNGSYYIPDADFTGPMGYRIPIPGSRSRNYGYASISIGYGSYSDNYSKRGELFINQTMTEVELGYDNHKGEFDVVPYMNSNALLRFILTGDISLDY